jgi:hypothetical protein
MDIQSYEKPAILRNFPPVELSYEETVHKRVKGTSVYVAIPEGQKCFAWMTTHRDRDVCFVVRLVDGKVCGLDCYPCCFDRTLSYGTVLYGSVSRHGKNVPYFYPEDMLQFKGRSVDRLHWAQRLAILAEFLELTSPVAFVTDGIVFTSPVVSEHLSDALAASEASPMKFAFLQHRFMGEDGFLNQPLSSVKRPSAAAAVFVVRPELKSDTYSLYTVDKGCEKYWGLACVPDYRTSVFLNGHFRRVWENANLDNAEESEDEDDFENVSESKYVVVGSSRRMRCTYSRKFRRWVPRDMTDQPVSSSMDLK